jgi:hypothetical protein
MQEIGEPKWHPGKIYFFLSAAMIRFMASMPTLMAPLVSSVMGM